MSLDRQHELAKNLAAWLSDRANESSHYAEQGGIYREDAQWIGEKCAEVALGLNTRVRVEAEAKRRFPVQRGGRR